MLKQVIEVECFRRLVTGVLIRETNSLKQVVARLAKMSTAVLVFIVPMLLLAHGVEAVILFKSHQGRRYSSHSDPLMNAWLRAVTELCSSDTGNCTVGDC